MPFNLLTYSFKIYLPILGISLGLNSILVLLSEFNLFSSYSIAQVLFFEMLLVLLLYALYLLIFYLRGMRFFLYVLILSILGFLIPMLLTQIVVSGLKEEPLSMITFEKEKLVYKSLFSSYLLIFTYFIELYVRFVVFNINALFKRAFLSKSNVEIEDKKIKNIVQDLANKMNLKTPRLFFTNEPTVYSFGRNENNGNIVLYEKCTELDELTLEAILAHELAHIKLDIQEYTLQSFLTAFSSVKSSYFSLPFLFSACWLFYDLIFLLNVNVESIEQSIRFFYDFLPFLLASTSFLLIFFARNFLYIPIGLKRPVLEFDEFKADALTYLTLKDVNILMHALDQFRKLQVRAIIDKPIPHKRNLFKRIKEIHDRIMEKGIFSKAYSNWLEYFKEDYSSLVLNFGKGFDAPKDYLRKGFLMFIDKICTQYIAFKQEKKKINLDIYWYLKLALSGTNIALIEWLGDEVYRVPKKTKNKIIDYLSKNLENFNAKTCCEVTNTSLYDVLTVVLTLLVDGTLSLTT